MSEHPLETPAEPAASEAALRFADLPLNERILAALDKAGIHFPTPIQAEAIPPALEGRDVMGLAQTGTGKTLAFMIPIAERLPKGRAALILTPTRELAAQVAETVQMLKMKHVVLIGGAPMRPQLTALASKPQVIIATPGRLEDHMARGTAGIDRVAIAVLDEADRMLDMGFMPPIERILAAAPADRQTLLFSATMPSEIEGLANEFMTDPIRIQAGEAGRPADLIEQEVVYLRAGDKHDHLMRLLEEHPDGPVLVFTRTRHGARKLAEMLRRNGHNAGEIHSDRTQAQRRSALKSFKEGRNRILAATDIAARGIDVQQISLVVNFDVPVTAEDYVHRIGRTGRAGSDGKAVTLAEINQAKAIWAIERATGKEIFVSEEGLEGPERKPLRMRPQSRHQDRPHNERRGPGRRPDRVNRPERPWKDRRPDEGAGSSEAGDDRPQQSYEAGEREGGRPWENREGGDSRPPRRFEGDRESKPWQKREGGRPWENREGGDSRPPRRFEGGREGKPWQKREGGRPWENREGGDSRPPRRFEGDRESKPWQKREGGRPWENREGGDSRPPRRFEGDRESKPWQKREGGRPWENREGGDSRPPRRFEGDREGKPWQKREGGRPWEKREGGEGRPERRFENGGSQPWKRGEGGRRSPEGEGSTPPPFRRFDPDAPLPWERPSGGGENGGDARPQFDRPQKRRISGSAPSGFQKPGFSKGRKGRKSF